VRADAAVRLSAISPPPKDLSREKFGEAGALSPDDPRKSGLPARPAKMISFALEYFKNITLDDYFVFRRKVLPESKVAS
jgi:hypothetical protein